MNAKEAAIAMIQKMSEDCTWEEIAYRVYTRSRLEQGLADVAAGRVTTHEAFKLELDEWLASLGQPSPSKMSASPSNGSLATR